MQIFPTLPETSENIPVSMLITQPNDANSTVRNLRHVKTTSQNELRFDVLRRQEPQRRRSSQDPASPSGLETSDKALSSHEIGNNDLDGIGSIMITFTYDRGRISQHDVRCQQSDIETLTDKKTFLEAAKFDD